MGKRTKKKKRRIGLKIFMLIFLFLFASWLASNVYLQTVKYELSFENLPKAFDGFKIVQLSDLHSATFGIDNRRLINAVKSQLPDIVVLTGDMINSDDTDYTVFYSLCGELAKSFEVYYIVGNHEQEKGRDEVLEIESEVERLGVTVLESVEIERDGEKINLCGLWFNLRFYQDVTDESAKQYYFNIADMNNIMGEKETDEFTVLLSHNPVYFETYAQWGADLTLSGHIHGGMVRIPFVGGVFSPEKELFPKYDSGKYTLDDSVMIVNRGLGNRVFGLRFFNCPEVTAITLKTK